MADFCKDCSIATFGEDFRELAGITTAEDVAAGRAASVICECCGHILVDPDGKRIKNYDADLRALCNCEELNAATSKPA